MFGILNNLAKATVGAVVQTPLAVVADVVTMGGAMNDKPRPYTAEALSNIVKNIEKAVK